MVLTVVKTDDEVTLRLSNGPEGDTLMDLSGSQDMDITSVVDSVSKIEGTRKVMLKLCRTRCEADTICDARELGIPVSVVTIPTPDVVEANRESGNVFKVDGDKPVPTAKEPVKAPKKRWGRCSYCNDETEMLPVPGFMICRTCAQIELGRMRERKAKGDSDAAV